MLHIFRNYQKGLYLLITIVVVISFSFYGTYSALNPSDPRGETAFVAIDGSFVSKGELDEVTTFLSTDLFDKWIFGGIWGPNFLNDGAIHADLMQTGLAQVILETHQDEVKEDLKIRLLKEKTFTPYSHPEGSFLSAASIWATFAPTLSERLSSLKAQTDPVSKQALEDRIALFLAERQFPAPLLSRVLSYQQNQLTWIKKDPLLEQGDLSLFGYHSLEDWFGPKFIKLAATFIINAAKEAEKKGFRVTKEEALFDLKQAALKNFSELSSQNRQPVATSSEYFQEQLRRLGISQDRGVKIWQQVLLFRRLFEAMGNTVLLDTLPHHSFLSFAKESKTAKLYQLPSSLNLGGFLGLQYFEVYLDAIREKQNPQNPLELPNTFVQAEKLKKTVPELVQKRYLVEVSQVNKQHLHSKVSLKDTWAFEEDPKNFALLKEIFPQIALKKATTQEERLAALDALKPQIREKVDQLAREKIVDSHPDWMNEALLVAPSQIYTLTLNKKLEAKPLEGIKKGKELMTLLDATPKGETIPSYSQDGTYFYRIKLLDKSADWEIMTFSEAKEKEVLPPLLEKKLKAAFNSSETASKDNSFESKKNALAQEMFAPILNTINQITTLPKPLFEDKAASYRFFTLLNQAKEALKQDADKESLFVKTEEIPLTAHELPPRSPLQNQWKLVKSEITFDRNQKKIGAPIEEMLKLSPFEWSSVVPLTEGGLGFFQILDQQQPLKNGELEAQILKSRNTLSKTAQLLFGQLLAFEIKEKKAFPQTSLLLNPDG